MCTDKSLIKFIKSIVGTYADVEECAKDYNVDKNLLQAILDSPNELNNDMRTLVSTILRKPIR